MHQRKRTRNRPKAEMAFIESKYSNLSNVEQNVNAVPDPERINARLRLDRRSDLAPLEVTWESTQVQGMRISQEAPDLTYPPRIAAKPLSLDSIPSPNFVISDCLKNLEGSLDFCKIAGQSQLASSIHRSSQAASSENGTW